MLHSIAVTEFDIHTYKLHDHHYWSARCCQFFFCHGAPASRKITEADSAFQSMQQTEKDFDLEVLCCKHENQEGLSSKVEQSAHYTQYECHFHTLDLRTLNTFCHHSARDCSLVCQNDFETIEFGEPDKFIVMSSYLISSPLSVCRCRCAAWREQAC